MILQVEALMLRICLIASLLSSLRILWAPNKSKRKNNELRCLGGYASFFGGENKNTQRKHNPSTRFTKGCQSYIGYSNKHLQFRPWFSVNTWSSSMWPMWLKHGSMGQTVYWTTWKGDSYGINVGKYTINGNYGVLNSERSNLKVYFSVNRSW